MILTNRLFERVPPSREAKSIYIFCEGVKREIEYFNFFKELDSRINIEVYKLHPHEDNSPLGLMRIAENCLIKSDNNPNPKYGLIEEDEVWIVLDIDIDRDDSREPQIQRINKTLKKREKWFIARRNAKANFSIIGDSPAIGCTEVYRLADSIIPLLKEKLDAVISQI